MCSVFDDFSSCWPKGVASPSLRLKYVTVGVTKHWTGSKGWHILYMGSGVIMINVSHPIGLYELQPGKWRPCEYSLCRCLKVKPKFKPRPVFRSYRGLLYLTWAEPEAENILMSIFLACSGAFWRKFSYICTYADITFITEYTRMQPKNNNYRFFDLIIPSASTRIGENIYKTLGDGAVITCSSDQRPTGSPPNWSKLKLNQYFHLKRAFRWTFRLQKLFPALTVFCLLRL